MSMRNTKKNSGSAVDNEVANLFQKKGQVTAADYARLRSKYNDVDLVAKIQEVFTKQHVKITKRAKKFAELVGKKYSDTNTPFHVLLQKALAYKKKHNLSDVEFAEFQRIYEQELAGTNSPEVLVPNTNMMKVLGNITTDLNGFVMKVSPEDDRHLKEILNIATTSRSAHAQVILQSMQYRDLDYESLTGTYSREHNNKPGEHVHPVIAAMFLPKIDVLEHHFLYANLAGIVKARKERRKLKTRSDYELFYSLVTDPNDIVCDDRSPLADLLSRVNLQQQLWNAVLHLRNGQYYNSSFHSFITSVDICKLNKHDTPDLIYGRFDGTVCKRLLAAFSFRPTVVATTPAVRQFSTNPYYHNLKPQVRQIQMINLRLHSQNPAASMTVPVNLDSAVTQDQIFIENRKVVLKRTNLIYSRGCLFFYVDRRAHLMRLAELGTFNLNRMPYAASGFQRLNHREVQFNERLQTTNQETYRLRSVVVAEVNRNAARNAVTQVIVGSSTLLMKWNADGTGYECFQYDPLGVIETGIDPRTRMAVRNDPVVTIPWDRGVLADGHSFKEMAEKRGTIFMYERERSDDVNVQIPY